MARWSARRKQFRAILEGTECVYPASVFDPLSACIAENLGYRLGMFAGSTASLTVLGAPDMVVMTATEFAHQALRICRVIDFPLMVDADHGYGNALNAMRTIEELEIAGTSAATIEDTALPTPFAAGGTVRLIPIEEGAAKLRAALRGRSDSDFAVIGRTSALVVTGLDAAVQRFKAYERAGVDALFVVGIQSIDQLRAISSAVKRPLILGGAPPIFTKQDFAAHRVKICLQGHLSIRAAIQAMYNVMKQLKDGTPPDQIEGLASPALIKALTKDDQYQDRLRSFL